VKFSYEAQIDELVMCNCSLCTKRNAVMVTVPSDDLHVVAGQDTLALYRWNTGNARHYFCSTCGIYAFHQRRINPDLYSVNVFCNDDFDIRNIPVRQVDGKSRSSVVS